MLNIKKKKKTATLSILSRDSRVIASSVAYRYNCICPQSRISFDRLCHLAKRPKEERGAGTPLRYIYNNTYVYKCLCAWILALEPN